MNNRVIFLDKSVMSSEAIIPQTSNECSQYIDWWTTMTQIRCLLDICHVSISWYVLFRCITIENQNVSSKIIMI